MLKPWPIAVDLVLIVVFATIGRASHAEALTVGGIAETAVPFLVAGFIGSVLGWLLLHRSWWLSGVVATFVTVTGGMLLRLATGGGVQPAFVIVASITLALFLLGWRLVWYVTRGRKRPH